MRRTLRRVVRVRGNIVHLEAELCPSEEEPMGLSEEDMSKSKAT
jgi:hypothetical protein